MTVKRDNFVRERLKDKTASNAEIARRAGYSPKDADVAANKLMQDERITRKIYGLGEVGLDALEKVATKGKNEIAVATAAKTLVETAYGKPKDNKQSNFGDVTINIQRLDPKSLETVIEPLKQLTEH